MTDSDRALLAEILDRIKGLEEKATAAEELIGGVVNDVAPLVEKIQRGGVMALLGM